jgi:HAD superfamily hydrolase (TIGR01549 family)
MSPTAPERPYGGAMAARTVVLDLDGTLVDSVPVHVLAWQAAFREVGLALPSHALHAVIGMGGDLLVAEVAGESAERSVGDEVRARHQQHLDRLFHRIVPAAGAVDLVETLLGHDLRVTLASSSDADLTDRLLELVPEVRHALEHVVTGSDAERTKPYGDLVATVLERTGDDALAVIGDTVWDLHAAHDAGVDGIGVLTGGRPEAELLEAGAVAVLDSPAALAEHVREHRGLPGGLSSAR